MIKVKRYEQKGIKIGQENSSLHVAVHKKLGHIQRPQGIAGGLRFSLCQHGATYSHHIHRN